MSYPAREDLTTGAIHNHLLRLAVPMAWGIFAIISYQLADMYFIAKLGTRELAAFTFTFPITMFIFYLVMGMGVATTSVVSRQIGRNDRESVRRLISHSTLIAFLAGLILSILGLIFLNPLLHAMGAEQAMIPLIRDYMLLWFSGVVFVTLPMVNNAAMRAGGDSLTPAAIMTLVAVINIVLDPLLIFGLWGFPRLELQGAAISTVIANACSMVAAILVLCSRDKMLFGRLTDFSNFTKSFGDLMHIAVPAGIAHIVVPLSGGIMIAILSSYGAESIAAFGVASRVESFVLVPVMATAVSLAPIIGQNWGANKTERVRKALGTAFVFIIVWNLLIAFVLAVFAKETAALFSADPDVITKTATYFLIVPLTYAAGTLINGWSSAFNAIGWPRRSLMMIAVKLLVVQIPLAMLFAELWGTTGVYLAIAATNIIAGLGFHIINFRKCQSACAGRAEIR